MHIHDQNRLAGIAGLGEGVQVSKIEAGVPVEHLVAATGIEVVRKLAQARRAIALDQDFDSFKLLAHTMSDLQRTLGGTLCIPSDCMQ
jgi:hypothetical protein